MDAAPILRGLDAEKMSALVSGADVGALAQVGRVTPVFNWGLCDPSKSLVAFATNEAKLDARTIGSIYERRRAARFS